jgi:hypothetical protein
MSKNVEIMTEEIEKRGPVAALSGVKNWIDLAIGEAGMVKEDPKTSSQQWKKLDRQIQYLMRMSDALNKVQKELVDMGIGDIDDWEN